MTCPDCDLHKIRASMWRNKAYELNGTPLPWNADELIEKALLAERESIIDLVAFHGGSVEIEASIRARSKE